MSKFFYALTVLCFGSVVALIFIGIWTTGKELHTRMGDTGLVLFILGLVFVSIGYLTGEDI